MKLLKWPCTPFLASIVAIFVRACSSRTIYLSGELTVLSVHVPHGLHGEAYYLKNFDDSKVFQLHFKEEAETLKTGDSISVKARIPTPSVQSAMVSSEVLAPSGLSIVQVVDFKILVRGGVQNPIQVNNISSITWLTNICGKVSISDVKGFRTRWVNQFTSNPASTSSYTMQNYYNACSFGKARFSGDNNIVVDLTKVPIPCQGVWQNKFWDANKCDSPEIFGWMDWVQNYTRTTLGINIDQYTRRVMVLPDNNCPWAGLASIGCSKSCMTWIKSPYTVQLNTVFHELGHNLGMQHSGTPGNEYGDGSCPLGGCCGDRCLSAPQSWFVGWSEPIQTLNDTNFPQGTWSMYDLPATILKNVNHVQVAPTWLGATKRPSFFFSFRQATGWDSGLPAQYAAGVSVHMYNGTRGKYSADKPTLLGVLSAGSRYSSPDMGFVMDFVSKNTTHAQIRLCRPVSTKETNCGDGRDDDCNGLIDGDDPACRGKVLPSPSPKPSPKHSPKHSPRRSPSPQPRSPPPSPPPSPRPPSPQPSPRKSPRPSPRPPSPPSPPRPPSPKPSPSPRKSPRPSPRPPPPSPKPNPPSPRRSSPRLPSPRPSPRSPSPRPSPVPSPRRSPLPSPLRRPPPSPPRN